MTEDVSGTPEEPTTIWQEVYQLNIVRPLSTLKRELLSFWALWHTVWYDALHPGKALLEGSHVKLHLQPPQASRAILKILIFLVGIQALVLLVSDHYADLDGLFSQRNVVGSTTSAHAAVDMGGISSDLPTEELDEFMVDVFLLGLYFLSLITILGLGNLFRWIGVFKRESSRTVSYLILSQYNILFFWVCSCLLFIMILPPQYGKTIWTEVILGISILLPFPITVFHFWRYRKYFSYNPLRGVMAWGVSWLTLTFLVSGLFDLCVVRLFLHMDGVGVAS